MMIGIVYWSGTGNTEQMAEVLKAAVEAEGKEVVLTPMDGTTPEDAAGYDVLLMGCPSMGDEVLEESTAEPFVQGLLDKVSGKPVGLFGSYGWGDGTWMRNWQAQMEEAGAVVMGTVIAMGEPDDGAKEELTALAKEAAAK